MYHLLDRVRDAIDEYLQALQINPSDFDANCNLATAYLQIDEPRMALPYAEAAVQLRGRSQNAHVNLGSIYSALGEHHLAIEAYRAAAEFGELEPQIALNMANSLLKTGAYRRAINVFGIVARARPDAEVYERLGYAHFKLGKFDRSLEHYRKALEYDPKDTAALNGVGVNLMTKYLRGRRENVRYRDHAIKAWRKSVRLKPDQEKIVDLIARYRKL
jgi:tetratricopeptide (TPR) repeat protein